MSECLSQSCRTSATTMKRALLPATETTFRHKAEHSSWARLMNQFISRLLLKRAPYWRPSLGLAIRSNLVLDDKDTFNIYGIPKSRGWVNEYSQPNEARISYKLHLRPFVEESKIQILLPQIDDLLVCLLVQLSRWLIESKHRHWPSWLLPIRTHLLLLCCSNDD